MGLNQMNIHLKTKRKKKSRPPGHTGDAQSYAVYIKLLALVWMFCTSGLVGGFNWHQHDGLSLLVDGNGNSINVFEKEAEAKPVSMERNLLRRLVL